MVSARSFFNQRVGRAGPAKVPVRVAASQMPQHVLRAIDDGIGSPRVRRTAVEISIPDRDRPHSGGAAGFDVTLIVPNVDASMYVNVHTAACGEEGIRKRLHAR